MRRTFFSPLFYLLAGSLLWSGQGEAKSWIKTGLKGFIALDLLSFEQREQGEGKDKSKDDSLSTGLGVIDLKFYAQHDKFSIKVKLDLDSARLSRRYNLFEEAVVSYTLSPRFKIRAGKGLVPFHRKHWGVIRHSYRDGGHMLNPEHFWRDQDKKILLTFVYGEYFYGFINSFTFWGNSDQVRRDWDTGEPRLNRGNVFIYNGEASFETRDQRGIANKSEFFWGRGNALSVAGIYYHNDLNPRTSWAFDIGHRYRTRIWEVWSEYTYGMTHTHPAARYATEQGQEHLLQLGGERYLTSLINILWNLETATVKNKKHDNPDRDDHNGDLERVNSYKLEAGLKFKTSKNAHITLGISHELKKKRRNLEKLPDQKAYEITSSLAFWF